ncbi:MULTISPECIES: ABC transporter ATP-binding protein [Aliagarivorans]|uniref:ABC transporter ATP-binding protein n=1 Tax=Aliagarivorans TaxID=882379 RepID=UPI00040693C7|nr:MULTISPECIES: ABC transporter ATP-binding protein [Aliagarivorans]
MTTHTASLISPRSLFRQVLQHRRRLVLANVIALLATLISVPLPMLMPMLVDEVLLDQPAAGLAALQGLLPASWQQPTGYIVSVFVIVVVLRCISQALNIWQSRQFTLVAKTLTCDLRKQLLEKLTRITMQDYQHSGSGGLSSKLVTDVETIDRFIGDSLSRLLVALLTVVGTALILLYIDTFLGMFILLVNPLVIYASRKVGSRVQGLKQRENQSFERFQQSLVEVLDGLYQLRIANRERHFLSQLKAHAEGVRQDADRFAWQSEAASRLSFLVFLLGFELFRMVAMLMVLLSDLSIGEIFAVFGYLWFMLTPVQELLNMQYGWFGAKAAIARINQLLQMPELEEDAVPDSAVVDNGPACEAIAIRCRDLHFGYDDERAILNGLDIDIQAGKRIALVGTSGGGKSTLLQVLLGLYRKQRGELAVNGQPIEQYGYRRLRDQVAVVLQHPSIFNTSLRENLCLGEYYSDQQLWEVLNTAQLADVVAQWEQGLDTPLGRSGLRLSGGQRQRLAIARMLLGAPKLVIMDEATSALDMATEQAVHQAMQPFLAGRTVIIVAHRQSAILQADEVYVLDDGKVAQRGTHKALLEQHGLYQSLYA